MRASEFSVMRRIGHLLCNLLCSLLNLVVNGILCAALATAGIYIWVAQGLPKELDLASPPLQQPLRVYSANGLLIGEYGAERREPLRFDDTPPLLVKAFLAAEDSRFFQHPGIDVQGLGRAALKLLETGERRQGGSTITMQVARNFFLSREKTFRRKLGELTLALRIERELTKEQIFELYQNKIFFGHRAYGISAAARGYYDKKVGELSLAQMAMLAGIPQAPSLNNPVSRPQRALVRRDYILGRMRKLGYISEPQYTAARAEPDGAALTGVQIELEAPHAAEMARREMFAQYGAAAYTTGFRVTTSIDEWLQMAANRALRTALFEYDRRHGYRGAESRVKAELLPDETALDERLAEHAAVSDLIPGIVTRVFSKHASVYIGSGRHIELALEGVKWARQYIDRNRRGAIPVDLPRVLAPGDLIRLRHDENDEYELAQLPAVEGALVALSSADGATKALVGGFDFKRSQFNRAVDSRRQPGSSFKPFVYAAALERGWTPATLLSDEALEIRDGSRRIWRPKNFDGQYHGPIRLREALTHSRNLASVDLLRNVGISYTREFATRFGFELDQLPRGLSLVLGTTGSAPLEMAGAYARFANGGYRTDPYLISRIQDPEGRTLFRAQPAVACVDCFYKDTFGELQGATALPASSRTAERVLEPGLTYQMRSLLGDVIKYGTGRRALKLGRNDLAGKTGTSNDFRDSWFCGFQKNLVAVAWMGFDDYSSLGNKETGGRAALGMWVDFMREALDGESEALPLEPPGLLHVRINRYSGYLTYADDPDAIMETVRQEYEAMLLGPDMAPYQETESLTDPVWTTDWGPYGIHRPVRPRRSAKENVLQRLF